MRYILLILTSLIFSLPSFSQCGTIQPEGHENIDLIKSKERLRIPPGSDRLISDDMPIITIPVVFHVLHLGETVGSGSNISNSAILNELSDMNDLFRKAEGSPSFNDALSVDTRIQFELATIDPDGNEITGIFRHDLSDWPFYASSGIHYNSTYPGAQGIREQYYLSTDPIFNVGYVNIWIVTEIGNTNSIAGFANVVPPWDYPNDGRKDGIVVKYGAILNGNTLAHEMGHWLNLYHVFSNDCYEDNCATEGDGVCDTPVSLSSPSCDPQNTLFPLPTCFADDNRNIMGYGGEACRRRLTEGQSERMRVRGIGYYRPWILENQNISYENDYDLSVSAPDFQFGSCMSEFNGYFAIKNVGVNTINSFYLSIISSSGNLSLEFINEVLEPSDTYIYNFNIPNNNYTFIKCVLITTSSEEDLNTFNNEDIININQLPLSKELVIEENFGFLPSVFNRVLSPPFEVDVSSRKKIDAWTSPLYGFNFSPEELNSVNRFCIPSDSCYSVEIYFDADETGLSLPGSGDFASSNCINMTFDNELIYNPGCSVSNLQNEVEEICTLRQGVGGNCLEGYYAIRKTFCNGEYTPSGCADIDNDGTCDFIDPCVGTLDICGVCNGPGAIYECGCSDIQAGNCGCCGLVEDAIGECGGTCQSDTNGDGICDD